MQTKSNKKGTPLRQQKSQAQLQTSKSLHKRTPNSLTVEFSSSFTNGTRKPKQNQAKSIATGQVYLPAQPLQKPMMPPSNHRSAQSLTLKANNCYSRSTAASISGSYCISNSSNISGSGKAIKDDSDKQEEQAQTEISTNDTRNSKLVDKCPQPSLIKPLKCQIDLQEPLVTSPPENKTLTKTQSQNRIKVMNTNLNMPQIMSKAHNLPQSPSTQKKVKKQVEQKQEIQVVHPVKFQRRRQSTLSSFKESFNESENFLNMEERLDVENFHVRTYQQPPQKSLKQLIKEKFLGPQFNENGQNESLLKRNILMTSSNLSSGVESNIDSIASSFKSSFIIMQAKQGILANNNTRLSYIKNRQGGSPVHIEAEYINLDDTDECVGENEEKYLDKMQDYQFQPKSLFTDESSTPTKIIRQEVQRYNGQGQMSDMVAQVKQGQVINPIFIGSNRPSDLQEEEQQQDEIVEFLQSDTHKMHLIQTLQSLQYIKNHLKQPPMEEIRKKRVTLPKFKKCGITKTLIFDLDETLVHCVEDYQNKEVDTMITVNFPNGDTATAGLNFRPYFQECLKKASEMFQVIVFTASHKAYADVVLDMIDPHNEIFEMRLYRDSCIRTQDGVYIKDLRIFQHSRRLEDIIIVDNAVYSFGYQLENGIPIIPFYHDKEDVELLHLIQYLDCLLKNGGNVRQNNQRAFQLRELSELDVHSFFQNIIGEPIQQQQEYQESQTQEQNGDTSWDEEQQLRQLKQSQFDLNNDVINEESNEEDESQSQIASQRGSEKQNERKANLSYK